MEFNLSSYFTSFDSEKDYGVEIGDVDGSIESITRSLANGPDSISTNYELFESLLDLVHGFRSLEARNQKQIIYLVNSSFTAVAEQCAGSMESPDFVDSIDQTKSLLEKYGYLTFVLLKFLGKVDYSGVSGSGRSKSASNSAAVADWKENCSQVEDMLMTILTVLKLNLSQIFVTTPERDLFVELFTRPVMNLMESAERVKVVSIKLLMFKLICISVKFHGHADIIQHAIIQCLTYYIHLPPYMAELLHKLADQYEYIVLTEEVLREISQTQFNSNDNNGPKSISEFLVKLSSLSPRLILKQIACVSQLLDNSNQALRCSVVETCGNIVVDIIKKENQENDGDEHGDNNQVFSLLDLLEERVLDQNPYVRTKAFQALTKVCSLPVKINERRLNLTTLAVRSLNDRSTLVRRNTIKLLSKLVLSHQFNTTHKSQLDIHFWKAKLEEAENELNEFMKNSHRSSKTIIEQANHEDLEVEDENSDMDVDDESDIDNEESKAGSKRNRIPEEQSEDDDDEHDDNENDDAVPSPGGELPDRNILYRAKLQATYYKDAVDFIEAIEQGTDTITKLLFSKNRNEVLEAMDFLVLSDAYGVKGSQKGIRRMLHLVWMKGVSDEGKSIPSHLIDCYRDIFLTAPDNISHVEQAVFIAKNLIGLTTTATVADLASLERLLGLMYESKLISKDIIQVLWRIYGFNDSVDDENDDSERGKVQRKGAIVILGMLGLADNMIIMRGVDEILSIGLGERGIEDLSLCKYSCIALQRLPPQIRKEQPIPGYIEREEELIDKLQQVLLRYDENSEWYSVAEQAINAIFQTSRRPDDVCSEIIKKKTGMTFSKDNSKQYQIISLSQLLFVVGHVAIKTIVYLEKLEVQFKQKKNDAEAKKAKEQEGPENKDDELEMIGGSTDDFTDIIVQIKEKELLFGKDSLLAKFGSLVKEICSNNNRYQNVTLQRSAVLCMIKLMCVSSIFCEENLKLLLVIMENSPDPIIRCNCVLGLGDMAVCFNNSVDESTDFLYSRLTDKNLMVQRTCLMTVTFLILAGQVKVKGQLSSMAKCLENEDQGISDMCRLFFAELSTKDNAIYNGFIDIFSGLSNDDALSKDSMKRIVKFLISFIDKEKQQRQLSEKLLVRLNKSQSDSEWKDVAFVLQTIPYKNDSITQALEGGYKLVSARQ